MRGDGYTYDPTDKHGPFLYYAAAGVAKIAGWRPAALDEFRLRSVAVLAGLGTIMVMLGAASRLGRVTVLVAAALLAVAPLVVIYDTYFIQEAWFCFFTWALFFAALKWWVSVGEDKSEHVNIASGWVPGASLCGVLMIGALVGLMQATKETSVLHFAATAVALWAIRPLHELRHLWPRLVPALGMAGLVYLVFYSAGFTHWSGVADGIRSYFHYADRASGGVHDQPWGYYFSILWPHLNQGTHWGEPLLLLMALVGSLFAFSSRAAVSQRALAIFTLTLLLIYSVIPYKTPWLLLTPYVGLALLAGVGVVAVGNSLPSKFNGVVQALICVALLLASGWRDFSALGRYANDERNPYLYQPTSSDYPRLVQALATVPLGKKIAVVSPDHAWPLPWALRGRAAVGYFATPPENLAAYDVVLIDSRLEKPASPGASPFGLRPNVILWSTSR